MKAISDTPATRRSKIAAAFGPCKASRATVIQNGQIAIRHGGGDMREIGGFGGGVDDKEQALPPRFVVEARHHQIIADATALIEQLRIAHLSWAQRFDVARRQALQRAGGILALKDRLPHMRDVEQARAGAGVEMLLDDAGGVVHRHVVAGEGRKTGAERVMQIVQRRVGEAKRQDGWINRHRFSRSDGRKDAARPERNALPPLSCDLRVFSRTAPAHRPQARTGLPPSVDFPR